MSKNIEWLKGRFRGRKLFKPQNDIEIGYNMAIDEFSEYVDQLDETEVLSQEFIEEHSNGLSRSQYIWVDDLKELLVPEQDEREQLETAYKDILSRGEFWFDDKKYKVVESSTLSKIENLEEITEEDGQKYYIDLGTAAYVAKWDGNNQVDIYTDGISGSDEFEFHLTKKEIEGFDKRYLAFAIPVDGIDSAISDIESGRINTYNSIDELIKELEE